MPVQTKRRTTPTTTGKRTTKKDQAAIERLMELAANRVVIEGITPEIDGGRFPAKSVSGRPFVVEADIFCDGHDKIDAALLTRSKGGGAKWTETRMLPLVNDRWRGVATFDAIGPHEFTIHAWRDLFASWQGEVAKKHAADQRISLELIEGTNLVERTLDEAEGLSRPDKSALKRLLAAIGKADSDGEIFGLLMTGETTQLMRRVGLRTNLSQLQKPLPVWVDREKALVSAWYELMPRSMSFDEERHGTFDDVIARLPYVKDLGFDVLYFTPIHPIGRTNRKGRNNSLVAGPDDPGSPYAIGAEEGGHDAIHPELGDFKESSR